MVQSKNIRSRREIRAAIDTLESPFRTQEIVDITRFTANKVQGLLRSMDGIRKELVDRSKGYKCVWHVEAQEAVQ